MVTAVDTVGTVGQRRLLIWLPGIVWVATVIVLFASLLLQLSYPTLDDPAAPDILFVPLFTAMIASLATVGALLALRRSSNPIGWMLLFAGLLMSVASFGSSYFQFAVASGRDLSLAALLGSVPALLFAPSLVSAGLVVLIFPSGRLPRDGWRILTLILVGLIATTVGGVLKPGRLDDSLPVANPFGVEGLAPALRSVETIGNVLLVIGFVLAAASMASRFRGARGEERKQLEWFAYVAVVLAVALAIASLQIGPVSDIAWAFAFLAFTLLPIAIAIAILKYRLYGIDRLVNRTLVYLPLVGILGGVYAAGVAFFQRLFLSVTGSQSDAAVVMTTLIVAGTFTPMRKSLESAVDRRFHPAVDGPVSAGAAPLSATTSGAAATGIAPIATGGAFLPAPATTSTVDIEAVLDDPRVAARMEEVARRVARESSADRAAE